MQFRCIHASRAREHGSTLVIVLWIAIGLVSLTLYFAQTMLSEVRASDHRVEGLAAEQAIEGGLRYATAVLANRLTNGYLPAPGSYAYAGVPLSGTADHQEESTAKFWFIGRETNSTVASRAVSFGLIDEGSKVNLNSARSNILYFLSDWNIELTEAILDWRGSNGPGTTLSWYGMQTPSYECKQAPFETTDELRLLFGAAPEALQGEDLNRNGVLDPHESDENRDGTANGGLLDLVTVYSREPNTYDGGTPRVVVGMLTSSSQDFTELLQQNLGTTRANEILQRLGLSGGGGGQNNTVQISSPLQLFRRGGFSAEEFAAIANKITVREGDYIEGRININTASSQVLSCLPGLTESPDLVESLANYRVTSPDRLTSVAWIVEALGESNQEVLSQLERQDILTTESYQFTADIAATGAYGRGYRRVRFVIDTALGTPRVIYRQDLTSLGWALGKEIRDQLLSSKQRNGSLAQN